MIDITAGILKVLGTGPAAAIEFYLNAAAIDPAARIYLQADGTLYLGSAATGGADASTIHGVRHESGGLDEVAHDLLVGFVSDEHVPHSEVLFTAGDGMTGGGTLAVSRDFVVGAGYAMAVAADALHLALDTILLHHGGIITGEYATLALAIAAAAANDTLFVPPGTWSGDVTVPANVTVRGLSRADCILTGAVTLSAGSELELLSIVRSIDSAGACYGVIEGAGGITATLTNVTVDVSNATGVAYAVYMVEGGRIDASAVTLLAETGSSGYAVYVTSGDFYHWSGVARGTTPLLPYRVP